MKRLEHEIVWLYSKIKAFLFNDIPIMPCTYQTFLMEVHEDDFVYSLDKCMECKKTSISRYGHVDGRLVRTFLTDEEYNKLKTNKSIIFKLNNEQN